MGSTSSAAGGMKVAARVSGSSLVTLFIVLLIETLHQVFHHGHYICEIRAGGVMSILDHIRPCVIFLGFIF